MQDKFERLILSPDFECYDSINNLLKSFENLSPKSFINGIIEIVQIISLSFSVSSTRATSILIGLLFRCLFDEVYLKIKLFFVPELDFDLICSLKDLTMKDVYPPPFCPNFNENTNISQLFKNDPYYKLSCDQFSFISFFTNPLDILHHTHHAILEIEKSALIYNLKNKFLAFDDIFSLLFFCILGSDIPELLRLIMFTDQFSPNNGLSSEFQFALTKLNTLSIHMQNLIQENFLNEIEKKKI